ncbi:MAG: hypothetical protein LBV30_10035, partial [Propionibacteriaceae bacterium]|nr:hypothetical protein [Propionibacteriaceae bacterium]
LQTNHGSVSIGDATDRQTEQLHEQSEQLQQIEGQVVHMAQGLAGHDKFRADTAAVLERQNTTLADLAKATAELAAGFKAQAAAQEQANYQINLLLKQGLMKGSTQ